MRKSIIFCFAILMFSTFVLADAITISRDLSNFNISEAFEVILEISISGNLVAVGIEEYTPVGATIINSSIENFRINGSKIEFLLFDLGKPIQNQNISYFVLLNSSGDNFTETHEVIVEEEVSNQESTSPGSSGGGGGGGSNNILTNKPATKENTGSGIDLSFLSYETNETAKNQTIEDKNVSQNKRLLRISSLILTLMIFLLGYYSFKQLMK